MLQVRWSLNSNNTAKRKRMASSFKPTVKNAGPVPLPDAPWAITSSFQPGLPKPERRPDEGEPVYMESSFSHGSAPSSPSPPEGGEVNSSGRATKRMAVIGGSTSSHAPPKALAMYEMEPEDLFDPLTLFTSSTATDLDDLSSLPSTMPQTLTAGTLAIPSFMPIPMLPKYLPRAPATQTERCATSPPEDATQKGSPCPSPTHISSIERDHFADSFDDVSFDDVPKEYEAAGAPYDPLDTLQLDDISSLLGGADSGLDLALPDDVLPASELTSGELHSEPELLCVNVEAATTRDEASRSVQLEMPSPESVQLDLPSVPGCSSQPSSSSTADTLSFDVGQADILAGLESLCEDGEMPLPLANMPPLADMPPQADMPSMPPPASSSSSAPPSSSAPTNSVTTNSASTTTSSSAPRRPTFPLQQADIVRMLNGEIPPTGDAEEMDLIMQMSAMPQDAGFFNMESILLAETPPSNVPPTIPLGHAQPMPSHPSMGRFNQVLPPPVSVGKPLGFVTPATVPSIAALEAMGLPMPPLNPPVKRTNWVHCDAEGKETKPGYKDGKAGVVKAKLEPMQGMTSAPKSVAKPPSNPPPKANMRDMMASWPPPSESLAACSSSACSSVPPSMQSRPSSVQFSTPYVPPSLLTPDALKAGKTYPHHLQQLVLNGCAGGGGNNGHMAQMASMTTMGNMGADAMKQPMLKGDKKKGKGFSWQSLKVFPTK